MFNSLRWPVATELSSTGREHLHLCRNFYWTRMIYSLSGISPLLSRPCSAPSTFQKVQFPAYNCTYFLQPPSTQTYLLFFPLSVKWVLTEGKAPLLSSEIVAQSCLPPSKLITGSTSKTPGVSTSLNFILFSPPVHLPVSAQDNLSFLVLPSDKQAVARCLHS